ncbi:MAG: hypothetical protein ABIU09_03230 [Pyrinomonadaceae bacterium]
MEKALASVIFTCFLCLTSCVPSLNPIYTEQDVVFDATLLGPWTDQESSETWDFTSDGDKAYKLVYTDDDGKKGEFKAHLFKIADETYLDLEPVKAAAPQNDFHKGHIITVHTFVRIAREAKGFRVFYLEPKWLKEFLEKDPSAVTHVMFQGEILLTDSTRNLQKFIAAQASRKGAFSDSISVKRKEKGATKGISVMRRQEKKLAF